MGRSERQIGRVVISCEMADDMFLLKWTELGGPPINGHPNSGGFGSRLIQAAVEGQLGGAISRDWLPQGVDKFQISLAVDKLAK